MLSLKNDFLSVGYESDFLDTLIDIKLVNEKLQFAFLDSKNNYHSNYEYAKKYEIIIDETVTSPTIKYGVVYEIENNDETLISSSIDSNTSIQIILNRENHVDELFGKPTIKLE